MTEGTWNRYLIAVHPDVQGTGVGTAMLHHIEQLLATRGERVLLVETSGLDSFALVGEEPVINRLGVHRRRCQQRQQKHWHSTRSHHRNLPSLRPDCELGSGPINLGKTAWHEWIKWQEKPEKHTLWYG
jgi:hypothetical protein